MGEILSNNGPEIPPKPKADIEWNDRTYQSYMKNGFPQMIKHNTSAPRDRLQQFLNEVDVRKGPIERTITSMVRVKAIDWSTEKAERKEYLYYMEDWEGKNWLGIPRKLGEHIEGKYEEVVTTKKFDERTGDHIADVWGGTRTAYYIPFNKKTVDEIIAKSAHTDKSNIRFVVKFAAEDDLERMNMSTHQQFSYEAFICDWDKLYQFQHWPANKLNERPNSPTQIQQHKPGKNLEFKPS